MNKPEIFKAYRKLNKKNPKEITGEANPEELNLRKFIETYVTSLGAIVKGFPKNNLDINALEAHTFDKLKYFFKYESFGDVDIETKEEVRFINEAIKLIEEWFYGGEWTSCLTVPKEEEIQKLFSGRENSFLQRTRRVQEKDKQPNLGRDGRYGNGRPLPNIYEDADSGDDLVRVYSNHAFKFFHSPAATINVFTKVYSSQKIMANDPKFQELRNTTFGHVIKSLHGWGYNIPKPGPDAAKTRLDPDVATVLHSASILNTKSKYIRQKQEYKRNLFFMKTCMSAAEVIRRTGDGELTKENFPRIMEWARQQGSKGKLAPDFFDFDFVAPDNSRKRDFGYSSILHVNTAEFPFALFTVDRLAHKYKEEHSQK